MRSVSAATTDWGPSGERAVAVRSMGAWLTSATMALLLLARCLTFVGLLMNNIYPMLLFSTPFLRVA
jgi:hypothetical protein